MRDEADLPTLPADGTSGDGVVVLGTTANRYGRFVSRGVIGQGGMGVVLRAHDPELDRHVAIKVLTPGQLGSADSTGMARLQREAQAMAKLSHPNIVTVFEMGNAGGSRFIAMELVEGMTLRRWLTGTHPWHEVVAAFVACGRGLAAAHAAGLVHRDFKPENVLIGADQRPRVTDFGLVATGMKVDGAALGDAVVSGGLTVDGAVIGTPSYMAPEQWNADECDARTDQFAFCIALWEGVFGERPFEGRTANELRANVLDGKVRTPPRERRVPGYVEAALRRGLSVDRGARWPSMNELLTVLDRPRRRRWPIAVVAVSVVAALGAVAFAATRSRSAANPCPDPAPRLAGVWDASMAQRVRAAFIAASPATGADTSKRVIAALDAYVAEWRGAALEACRATKVEGSQSAQLLDQRMMCLDRRLDDVRTLSGALVTADRDRVNHADDDAGSLVEVASCANKEALLAFPRPTNPAMRQRVVEIEKEIHASEELRYSPDLAAREARATAALAAAHDLGYPPLVVRALEELEDAASINTDHAVMKSVLRELAQKAAEVHDDARAAGAWLRLIALYAQTHERDEAKALLPVAEAAVARAGSPPALVYGLAMARGTAHFYASELDDAIAAYEEALENARLNIHRAIAAQALARAVQMRDGPARAMPLIQQSVTISEEAYGAAHPIVADALELESQAQLVSGQLEPAYATATRVREIREAALPPEHREIGMILHQLAMIDERRGNTKEARELYERAIAIFEKAGRKDDAALSHAMLGGLVADKDGIAAARTHFEIGLSGLAESFGPDSVKYIEMEVNFVQRLIDADLCTEAQPRIEHVVSVLDAQKLDRYLTDVLSAFYVCDEKAGRVDKAIAMLERSQRLCKAIGCDYAADIDEELAQVRRGAKRRR